MDVRCTAASTCDECGASAVEYGLIVVAIAAVVVAAAFGLGRITESMFSDSCQTIASTVGADSSC